MPFRPAGGGGFAGSPALPVALTGRRCRFFHPLAKVKTDFSRHVPAQTRKGGAKAVWQPRFYDHCIRNENDFHKHLDYIHYNPVKHGLASAPGEWPHSSFARFVALGWYPYNWGEMASPNIEDIELE
ncbi:MAG: hypothetical protein Q7T96_10700 [Methylobacter sp.]|nr:hypothetical protein [Methylobacter sp.]